MTNPSHDDPPHDDPSHDDLSHDDSSHDDPSHGDLPDVSQLRDINRLSCRSNKEVSQSYTFRQLK